MSTLSSISNMRRISATTCCKMASAVVNSEYVDTGEFERQKKEIKELLDSQLVEGDAWYLLDAKWYSQWKTYVGFDDWNTSSVGDQSANPGPVDNSFIVMKDNTDIPKPHMLENMDYILVPEDAWKKLIKWYSLRNGQVPLSRRVIKQGLSRMCKVEVYLIDLQLFHSRDMQKSVVRHFSHVDTLQHVVAEMRRIFEMDDNVDIVLESHYAITVSEPLNNLNLTLEEAGIGYGHRLVIREKPANVAGARQPRLFGENSSSRNDISSMSSYSSASLRDGSCESNASVVGLRDNSRAGLCGLSNLGNTCFMNSALQCMSNVSPLTDYMLSDRWREELNTKNPLGMRGEIATTYAALIQSMWSGKNTCAVPRNFKVAVGRFKPEFSGYQQQDSQELMAFLLDGLHEDLNRIRNKPYVEIKEADSRPDEEVAVETWRDYQRRNDSVIVDTFHGLLKSTLVCPDCAMVSVKFDPFCYLSLPLPIKKERPMTVYFVPRDPRLRLRQCKVTVPKMGSIQDLCTAVATLLKVAPDKLVVIDVYNHRFHKVFMASESVTHITERDDIYVFEVPVNSADDPDTVVVPVYMREVTEKRAVYGSGYTQLFGLPILASVPRHNCCYNTLYNCVLAHLVRYVKVPLISEYDAVSTSSSQKSSDGSLNVRDGWSENGVGDAAATADGVVNDDEPCGSGVDAAAAASVATRRLFTLQVVNSYGSTEVDRLADDGKPLNLDGHIYVSADWTAKNRTKFYIENEAKEYDIDASMEYMPPSKKQAIHLTDCLELFTSMERLGEHDPWYCPTCKQHQQATKKFDLWELPQILVIHLKRFSYNRYWRDKLDTFIDYPVRNLDMSQFVINQRHPKAVYDLIAVSNHYGGLGGGHYTACAQNALSGQWYNFDDSSVSSITEESVVTKAGYVLVYQRCNAAGSDPSTSSHSSADMMDM